MDRPGPEGDPLLAVIRANRGRFTTVGLVLMALGALAIVFPLVASIATKVLFGWLVLISGAVVLWHAFQARDWGAAVWSGLIGVLQIAAGVWLAFFPFTGLIGLTFLLGLLFLIQGGLEGFIALTHRPLAGWVWLGLSGAASIVLGVLLIAGLPGTALWALGLMLGLNLLTSGLSFLILARS